MGRFISMGRMSIIILIYIMMPVALAANDTDPSLLIGDPIKAFQQLPSGTQGKIILMIGLVAAAAIICGLIALFSSSAKSSAGAAIGNAAMRNEGSHNILIIVGTAILLAIAVGVFWFFMTGGF